VVFVLAISIRKLKGERKKNKGLEEDDGVTQ